jgi:hypothetical protein
MAVLSLTPRGPHKGSCGLTRDSSRGRATGVGSVVRARTALPVLDGGEMGGEPCRGFGCGGAFDNSRGTETPVPGRREIEGELGGGSAVAEHLTIQGGRRPPCQVEES